MDTDTIKFERQGKVDVLVIGVQEGKEPKYLVQQRKKQLFYGFYGYVTGKVRWGEEIIEAATREFVEETGLTGSPILLGVEHKMDIKDGKVLEDKFFHVCRVNNPKGDLIGDFEGGRNLWLSGKEIHDLPKLFPDVFDVLEMVKGKRSLFRRKNLR